MFGAVERFQSDPALARSVPFHEYFNGDTGAGVGASHQTGWTALVAKLLATERRSPMKAIAVFPGRPGSVHLAELTKPSVADVAGGRGVLVKVLRVGVDGTDREINAAEYGARARRLRLPGDRPRRLRPRRSGRPERHFPASRATTSSPPSGGPGTSLYDAIGLQDMTTDDEYFERGINLRHGYLTEYYVEDEELRREDPARARRTSACCSSR